MIELQGEAKAFLDMKIDSVVHPAYKVDDCMFLWSPDSFAPCDLNDCIVELWYPKAKKASTEKGIHTKPSRTLVSVYEPPRKATLTP